MSPEGLQPEARKRRRTPLKALLFGTAVALPLAIAVPGHAQEMMRNLFGSPGLVDMPSARMAPDGQLSLGGTGFRGTQRYNLGFQALPWLETSFRYSGLSRFDPAYPVYYDRSFAFKLRLWDETAFWPAVAVGVNDIVGTGVYGGEYIVATKRIGALEGTLGMGFGRLGTANKISNPFGLISDSFKRPRGNNAPGATNFNRLCHGPNAGIFGGLVWHTPVEGLSLAAEYSSDAYTEEARSGNFRPKSQINLSAQYQVFDSTSLGVSWLYGNSVGASLSFQVDPIRDSFQARIGPEMPPVTIRPPEQQEQALTILSGRRPPETVLAIQMRAQNSLIDALWALPGTPTNVAVLGTSLALNFSAGAPATICATAAKLAAGSSMALDSVTVATENSGTARCSVPRVPALAGRYNDTIIANIRSAAAAQSVAIQTIRITGGTATIYYANMHYAREEDALERLTRILMTQAPPEIEEFRLISVPGGIAQREFDVLRGQAERTYSQTAELPMVTMDSKAVPMGAETALASIRYPRFSWSLSPQARQQLFDPSNPFAVQFVANASATLELLPGLSLQGQADVSLYDNFNTLRFSDSLLPHVRTDFVNYFTKGKHGIGNLEADYRFRLGPSLFAVVRAGYLESMFAGVGGEFLWRPQQARWAIGANIYGVQQRKFDRLFGLQNYSVITGHLSAYYASPFYDIQFAVHAGRYLAGDNGITFEATRRFRTGIEIGAFFTKTNVSAVRFGEGSFDKGIIIRVPLGAMIPIHTQSEFNLELRPVQRDGGQRLMNDKLLFRETQRTSQAETELLGAGDARR